jgi:hypothetical protein
LSHSTSKGLWESSLLCQSLCCHFNYLHCSSLGFLLSPWKLPTMQVSVKFQPIEKIVNFWSGPIQVKRQSQSYQEYKEGQTALPLCAWCAMRSCTLLQKYILPCWDNSPFLYLQLWLQWSSGVLFPTILGIVQDNSIQKRCSEAPKADASLCLVSVASGFWTTGALGLEIHSGPGLSQKHREKGP